MQGLVETLGMDATEIGTYKELIRDLIEFESECGGGKVGKGVASLFPKMYAGEFVREEGQQRAYYIALEDLSPDYTMMDFDDGLTPDQLEKSLRALAHLHALCYSMKKRKGLRFAERYNFLSPFFSHMPGDEGLGVFTKQMLEWFQRELQPCDKHKHLMPCLEKAKEDIRKRFRVRQTDWSRVVAFNVVRRMPTASKAPTTSLFTGTSGAIT